MVVDVAAVEVLLALAALEALGMVLFADGIGDLAKDGLLARLAPMLLGEAVLVPDAAVDVLDVLALDHMRVALGAP